MRAGGLDRQITIEKKSVTQDSQYNTDVVTWVPLVVAAGSPAVAERFWAQVQDVMPSRSESVRQGLAMARNQTRIRMRWRNDIDSTMRVTVHGDTDTVYQIVGGPAEIEGRKERIELVCERYSSDGAGA
jgi:head-tail adaptor